MRTPLVNFIVLFVFLLFFVWNFNNVFVKFCTTFQIISIGEKSLQTTKKDL